MKTKPFSRPFSLLAFAAASTSSNAQPRYTDNISTLVDHYVISQDRADAIISRRPGVGYLIGETIACPLDPCSELLEYRDQWGVGRLPGGRFLSLRRSNEQTELRVGTDLQFVSHIGLQSFLIFPGPVWIPEIPSYRFATAAAVPYRNQTYVGIWRRIDEGIRPATLFVIFRGDNRAQPVRRGCGNHYIIGTSNDAFDHASVAWSNHDIFVPAAFISLPRASQEFRILRLGVYYPELSCINGTSEDRS